MDIHPIAPEKRLAIEHALARIEVEHRVRILFACESGSRGWGFSSPDSDYDARFIYVHARDWYLTVNERSGPGQPQRDVIELPIENDLDVAGWDLRKALRLLSKSNPQLSEWLRSPIVYRQDAAVMPAFIALVNACYSPVATWWHYFNMAKGNFREYLRGERIRAKKYLYVLRPVLACRWIEHQHTSPPMAFEILLDTLIPNGALRTAIDALLTKKRASAEVEDSPRIPEISDYLETELAHMESTPPTLTDANIDHERLDAFFRSVLR